MAIVGIRHNVGKNSINHPDDVRKVADLLVKVGFWAPAASFAPRSAESTSGALQRQEPPRDLLNAIQRSGNKGVKYRCLDGNKGDIYVRSDTQTSLG